MGNSDTQQEGELVSNRKSMTLKTLWAMWAYGDLRADLVRRGESIGSLDTLIAAHALSVNAVLVTNNTREFSKVQGLQLENWVTAK